MKKFFEEFKKFALRGNVVDLAVGVIIGGAFTGIVNALTNNFINPLLAFVLSGFTSWGNLADGTPWTAYGAGAAFLTTIVNFFITAMVLFLIVKAMNSLTTIGRKKEAPKAPTTKQCPYCLSEIPIAATRCAHCTSELPENK